MFFFSLQCDWISSLHSTAQAGVGIKTPSFCQDIPNTVFMGGMCNPEPQLVESGSAPPAPGRNFLLLFYLSHFTPSSSSGLLCSCWDRDGKSISCRIQHHPRGSEHFSIFTKCRPQTAGIGNPQFLKKFFFFFFFPLCIFP